jgi:signal peptidase I
MRSKSLLKIFIGLVLIICLYFNPYKIIMVMGDSMHPTLKSHQLVLAKKIDKIERGDIVIAYNDTREIIIKRVVYLPNETYTQIIEPSFTEPKLIEDMTESDLMVFLIDNRSFAFDCKIPKDNYFVMGDNRKNSDDSRRFGTLNKKDIIYKVVYR